MDQIKVLSFYKFLPLQKIEDMGPKLKNELSMYNTKGTVLLSPEGVNATLSVSFQQEEKLKEILNIFFGSLRLKEQTCQKFPFKRLLVRLKKESITFKENKLKLSNNENSYLEPETLKKWYEENKDILIMDVRNEFEIAFGSFKNALNLKISKFTEFKEAISSLSEKAKNKTIVTYCTGGIRCEKAVPYMKELGFTNVYQLEGGILNYFEKCGESYYEGTCFVFDHRISLDPNLQETELSYCTYCQKPIEDPEIKKLFSINERFCEECYTHIPKHLKKSWDKFLKRKSQSIS